jgi:hypothetical protein
MEDLKVFLDFVLRSKD